MAVSMADNPLPSAEIPPPIVSNVPGTWAYDTMSRRVRENILMRIFEENDLQRPEMSAAKQNLQLLVDELSKPHEATLRNMKQDGGPDLDTWTKILQPYIGHTWLDAPWCITEFYLYRRVAEAFDYFHTRFDPFEIQKQQGVQSSVASTEAVAQRLNGSSQLQPEQGWKAFAEVALWGNRMDLSLWPVSTSSGAKLQDTFTALVAEGAKNVLADSSDDLISHLWSLKRQGGRQVDIVVDNAGFELICDLCFADYLISSGAASKVVLQMKAHPTFVSDAMEKDLQYTLDYLLQLSQSDFPACVAAAARWQGYLSSGSWQAKENYFWVQPQPFWDMPQALRQELAESSLVVVKGDANYRRLLGDRYWDLTTPFNQVANYFPTTVCALRTLKAELGCGMPIHQIERAKKETPQWLVSGKYAVIQVYDPNAK